MQLFPKTIAALLLAATALNCPAQPVSAPDRSPATYSNEDLLKVLSPVEAVRQSADEGSAAAQLEMATRYQTGDGVPRDALRAFAWMQKAAQHDDDRSGPTTEALYRLGTMYELGRGTAQDLARAAQLYRQAAQSGFCARPDPQFRLGRMYENGVGVPQDYAQAAANYLAAAQFGPAVSDVLRVLPPRGSHETSAHIQTITNFSGSYAAENLFNLYLQGRGLPDDRSQAAAQLNQFKDSVKTARWQFLAGEVYYQGKLVPKDVAVATGWFNKAAAQGSPEAMNRLGEMSAAGIGTPGNAKTAAAWYRKAAMLSLAAAQLNLAHACLNGNGVKKNSVEARAWLQLAANQNLDAARDEAELLDAKLSPDQRDAATRLGYKLSAAVIPPKALPQ